MAVLALHHREAKVAGATQVRPEIMYTKQLIINHEHSAVREGLYMRGNVHGGGVSLFVPRVSSISKCPAAAFQMVDLISQFLNLSNQPFLSERGALWEV